MFFGIRHNIFISALLHSLTLAAAFIAGSSSELKVDRLIDVSLIGEWKTGIERTRSEAPLPQQSPKANSVKLATLKPRAQRTTSPYISGRKESVISNPESEIKPLPAITNMVATSVSSTITLSGIPGAEQNTSPVGAGTGFAAQGKTGGYASAISDIIDSRQQQGSPGDASLRRKIRDAIQSNLVYPYIARKRRIGGTTLVEFKINQRGMPEDFKVVRSSGHSILDIAAKETVVKASPFPALNNTIEIPITFLLKDNR